MIRLSSWKHWQCSHSAAHNINHNQIKQLITITVITLSDFNCIWMAHYLAESDVIDLKTWTPQASVGCRSGTSLTSNVGRWMCWIRRRVCKGRSLPHLKDFVRVRLRRVGSVRLVHSWEIRLAFEDLKLIDFVLKA